MKKAVLGGVYIFIGSFCFSTKAIMIKLAYEYPGVDAVSVLMLRMLFSLPFFVLIGYWNSKNREKTELKRADWLKLIGLGFVGYYVSSILDFKGLEYVSAGLERLILFAYPTIVLILSAIFYKRPIKGFQYVALALTYIGVGIAVFPDINNRNGDFIIGTFMVIGAAITYAIYLVESGEIIPKIGSIRFTSITMSFAALAIFLNFILVYGFDVFDFKPEVYGLCLLMAIIATVIPTFLLSEGMRLIGSGNAAIISSIGPVLTIFLAYIFLDEILTPVQYLGAFFVLGGVILITFRKDNGI